MEPWLRDREHFGDFRSSGLDGWLAHGSLAADRHPLGLSAPDRNHRAAHRLLALRRLAYPAEPESAPAGKYLSQRYDGAALARSENADRQFAALRRSRRPAGR